MKKYIVLFLIMLCIPFGVFAEEDEDSKKEIKICNKGDSGSSLHYTHENSKWTKVTTSRYEADGIGPAYCIQPGKRAPSQGRCTEYQLKEDFLSDGCESSNSSVDCGLAALLSYASQNGTPDYVKTLTGLRFWNMYKTGASGGMGESGDGLEGVALKQSLYTNSIQKLLNGGYDPAMGDASSAIKNLLYDSYGEVLAGKELFDKVNSGELEVFTASIEVVENEDGYTFDKEGKVKVKIQTNFNSETKIIGIKVIEPEDMFNEIPTPSGPTCGEGCYEIELQIKDVKELETCDTMDVEIEITYNDKRDTLSKIKKYETNYTDYQTFIVYDEKGDDMKKSVTISINCEQCDSAKKCCPGDSYESGNKNCGKCNDTEISYSVPSDCAGSPTDDVEGEIKDPELCALTSNKDAESKYRLVKNEYTYNGNKVELCSVYCREKFKFTFMGIKEAKAGRTFKYNVQGEKIQAPNQYLTNVIATRECAAAKIDYDQWKKDYEDLNKKLLEAWNKWKFYEVRANREKLNVGMFNVEKRCDSCDSQTCYTWVQENDNWVKKETGKTPEIPAKDIKWTWYKWDNAIYGKTSEDGNTQDDDASGQSGSDSFKYSCPNCYGGSYQCEGDPGESASGEAAKWQGEYLSLVETRKEMEKKIKDCNLILDDGVKRVIENYEFKANTKYEYDDIYSKDGWIKIETQHETGELSRRYCTDCTYESLCPNCTDDISNGINGGLEYEKFVKWECQGEERSAMCKKDEIEIPKSKASYGKIEVEEAYFQSNTFFTNIYDGIVTVNTPGANSIPMKDDEDQTQYLFPLELNKKDGSYETKLEMKDINKDFRTSIGLVKIKNFKYTCSVEVTNETIICERDCKKCIGSTCFTPEGSTLGFIFRPIDMSDVFPNESRVKGRNWTTANAQNVITAIETLNEGGFWGKVEPQYSVTLTPSQIREIKNSNKSSSYVNFSLTCEHIDGNIIDPTTCISPFVTAKFDVINGRDAQNDKLGNPYKWSEVVE